MDSIKMGNQIDKKISIIMPAYNQEQYIADAIESMIGQTFPFWEMIIVDDGSTDKTGIICDQYSYADERISVRHIPHSGVSEARNTGLRLAEGEWIVFIDSDDFYLHDALQVLIDNAFSVDCVIGSYFFVNNKKNSMITDHKKTGSFNELVSDDFRTLLYGGAFHCVYCKLYKKERIKVEFEKGLYYGEDLQFNLNVLPSMSQICIIPDIIYGYRYRQSVSCGQKIDLAHPAFERRFLKRWHELLFPEKKAQLSIAFQYYVQYLIGYFYKFRQLKRIPVELKVKVIEEQLDNILVSEGDYGLEQLSAEQREFWLYLKKRDFFHIFLQ